MSRKGLNYCEVYDYLQDHTTEETAVKFNSTDKMVALIQRIGDALLERAKAGKPLEAYTPRELMMELANRGYRGNLTYTQTINISNF